MFLTIFKYELNYWFKKPAFYIYLSIFVLLAFFSSAASAGIFDSITATTSSSRIVNSPVRIFEDFNTLTILIFFLFPSIIGVAIYRDYKSEMHSILYSFPFTKTDYLLAKFFSGITIVSTIVLSIALGMIIGFRFPGTNQSIVSSLNIIAYLKNYLVFILPNILLFGSIVFAIVTFSRNIAAGFIMVILLFFFQSVLTGVLADPEEAKLLAILDPFGGSSISYYTKYWTPSEQNTNALPLGKFVFYNRLLWLSIATIVFGLVFRLFSFHQNPIKISFKKQKGERVVKSNFNGITKIQLPKIHFDFSFKQQLKTTWKLSNIDLEYIIKSWAFLAIVLVGLLLMVATFSEIGNIYGTSTLPVTWKMLSFGSVLGLSILICTFLYAGLLIHRGRMTRANHLLDVTPVSNWVLLFSKVLAIVKMQVILLSIIFVAGVFFQTYTGYFNYEIGHYLFELFVLDLLRYAIWAFLAVCIQTLFKNPYLGLFVLLVLLIGLPLLTFIGVERSIFKYGQGPGYLYSDMNGYSSLLPYFSYKIYWFLGGCVLLLLALFFWVRGFSFSFAERIWIAKQRFKGVKRIAFYLFLSAFLGLGTTIFFSTGGFHEKSGSKQAELDAVKWEKTYKKYENYKQPRIVAVNTSMHIFPKKNTFNASATYTLVNKTKQTIDSVFLNHNSLKSSFEFNKPNNLVLEDTVFHFDIYYFEDPIKPGDSIELKINVKSKRNSIFKTKSSIKENGTFINNFSVFPSLGYSPAGELRDNKTRKKYKLPPNNLRPYPTDSTALNNTYISKDSDWIDFEATVSTSIDQTAIAPGYLQKKWTENDRNYFYYKMDSKILNFYAFNSAKYEVKKEIWNGISLEIYYHKPHTFNLERMFKGMKASLEYNEKYFSPYQFKQLRIIEFPKTMGSFAQSFANTIPYSEGVGFIADVDEENDEGVDYPFAITVHEVAHQWWAHQVIGADVLGATMLSESLSEYVSLKVLEHEHGKEKMRTFLKDALDTYLLSRTFEQKREKPLMYNDGQTYIRYQKGSLVFYALSDYIGEEKLNKSLKKYVEKVKFQEAPYTTSIEMVNYIKEITPDSLQYVIKDMFETITLYKNKMVDARVKELENGKYEVTLDFEVCKYRNDEKGKRYYGEKVGDTLTYQSEKMKKPILSIPLQDYIDVGVFKEVEVNGKKTTKELYLQKHKITQIHNQIKIIVDEKPTEAGIDPYNKLIDTQSEDNRIIF